MDSKLFLLVVLGCVALVEMRIIASPYHDDMLREKRSPDDDELKDSVKNVFDKVSKTVSDTADGIKNSDVYHSVSSTLNDFKDKVKEVGSDLKEKIKKLDD